MTKLSTKCSLKIDLMLMLALSFDCISDFNEWRQKFSFSKCICFSKYGNIFVKVHVLNWGLFYKQGLQKATEDDFSYG